MTPETYQTLQLLIGSGILLAVVRVSFQLGSYSQRIEAVERDVQEIKADLRLLRGGAR